ncbi:hypothetical protein SAMN02927921_01768 [Sinomicrobium oceani]|uniref:Uncharacterized protein n=1 Tax=Sinomicrobium oceani TaxID=1150368 RepID=A0A1K1PGE9_9FLAO|nr:hypothetical protein SAMN02927921_01768 [Sinomicrobium oceani]
MSKRGKIPFHPGVNTPGNQGKSPLCRFPHPDTFDQNKYGAPGKLRHHYKL